MINNFVNNKYPFYLDSMNSMNYNNNRNKIKMQKKFFSYNKFPNDGRMSLTKNTHKKQMLSAMDLSQNNGKHLTRMNSNLTNSFIMDNSLNIKYDNYFLSQERHKNSVKNHKDIRFLSSGNNKNDYSNPAMTVLINNGVIKNMFINNNNKKLKNDIKLNYTQQINNISNNLCEFPVSKLKMNNNLYKRKTNDNDNIHNLTYSNIYGIGINNNSGINSNCINNCNNNEMPINYSNKIKLIEKYKNQRNTNNKNNINITKAYMNNNNNINNKNINLNYFNQKNTIKNKPMNQKMNNNNNNINKHLYSKTNIYSNKDIEDISSLPLPVRYMEQNNSSQPKKLQVKIQQLNDVKENKNKKGYNFTKMKKNKNFNKIKTENNNDLISSSSSSSDELSLIANDIVNKFYKNKLINRKIYSDKKRYNTNNGFDKILKNNNDNNNNTATNTYLDKNINININSSYKDNYNNIKKRKINSLIIPVNINNFNIQGNNNDIIINDDNNNNNNYEDDALDISNEAVKDYKDFDNNKISFSGITINNYQLKKKNKIKKNEINRNKYDNIDINNNNEKENENKNKEKINNDVIKDEITDKKTENEMKKDECIEEDCFSLIEQIMKKTEDEERNKKDRHINFNLENNIYIYYKPKDLITQNVIYKGNKKKDLINVEEKKMDIYFELLKSKNKFNSIIKKYDKNEIKINKDYELNEDLEEYEILGDLYNIFFSKNINDLDKKLKKSIDKFMKDKNI